MIPTCLVWNLITDTASTHSGAALLALNNAVNTISRIGMGFVADIAGRQNTLVLSVLGSAITVVAFWLSSAHADDMALWITFVITYGIFAGGTRTIPPDSFKFLD